MRTISSSLAAKFKQPVQAESTKSAPALDLWISRPVVPLVNDYFLEQQEMGDGGEVTALDIAVCHPRHRRQSTRIYIATVENGRARVESSPFRQAMETHLWVDSGFDEPAEDVAIAFDAATKNDTRGRSEFVTEEQPWVFWVNEGALYGRELDSDITLTLAETNCTRCTAIRAAGSALGGFDYGLCLFFLLGGDIYVRQYMDGEWMDAEPVNFGPDVVWTDIAASRSWDYRIVLQAMASDGTVYELFTQYMGIGQRSTEHINMDTKAHGRLTELVERDASHREHLDLETAASGKLTYGLSSMPVAAANADNGQGDFGFVVTVVMDYPVTNVEGNAGAFMLRDSNGVAFSVLEISVSEDGKILTLTTVDFNSAQGDVTVAYSPGTIQSPAVPMEAWEFAFTPEGLVAPTAEAPVPVELWNIDPEGTKVAVRFSEALVAGTSSKEGWSVSIRAYDFVPGGTVQTEERVIAEVTGYAKVGETLAMDSAILTDTQLSKDSITLEVAE